MSNTRIGRVRTSFGESYTLMRYELTVSFSLIAVTVTDVSESALKTSATKRLTILGDLCSQTCQFSYLS